MQKKYVNSKNEEVNKQLQYGDKRIIANVTGYHPKHVINVLNGKKYSPATEPIIFKVAKMILSDREKMAKKIEKKSLTPKS